MTTSISSINSTQSALQVNGVNSVVFDNTGIVSGADLGIKTIGASVASSALTITFAANQTTEFRSATLTSGTVTQVTNAAALSLVVPSTATLGTVSTIQSRLVVLALNNAGTMELAVVNIAGGNDLTETGVISTTAISAAATSASVVYSTTARTGVAYRVVGYVESTQATAGTWATAPSTIQGCGGQALVAMSSLGYGQTWQSVTRTTGVTYYNTTGKPITVTRYTQAASASIIVGIAISINGGASNTVASSYGSNSACSVTLIIGLGESYMFTDASAIATVTFERR